MFFLRWSRKCSRPVFRRALIRRAHPTTTTTTTIITPSGFSTASPSTAPRTRATPAIGRDVSATDGARRRPIWDRERTAYWRAIIRGVKRPQCGPWRIHCGRWEKREESWMCIIRLTRLPIWRTCTASCRLLLVTKQPPWKGWVFVLFRNL